MIVGIVELEIYIYEANSLKDKRRVLKSLTERLRSRFNISIAEVALNDKWNRAGLGISLVANDVSYVNKQISKLVEFIDGDSRVEIICKNIEIV